MKGIVLLAFAAVLVGCAHTDYHDYLPKTTELVEAVKAKDLFAVSHAFGAQTDPNRRVFPDISPLEIAVNSQQYDVVELLVKNGANPKTVSDGYGPLEDAVLKKDIRMIKLLLRLGAGTQRSGTGSPAIILAAEAEDKEIIDLLLAAGADINDQDISGHTVLTSVAQRGNLALTKYAVEKGADPNLSASDGTALALASEFNEKDADLVNFLKDITKPRPEFTGYFNQHEFFKRHPERRPRNWTE